jgi:hypothetical protein
MRLGETLIATRVLTELQLDRALKAQLIHGGHLGTNLIELDFIDEDTLGKVLSETTGVPYAPPKLFASIPDATIRAVPEKVAEEYQGVPVMLTEQAVHVALVNPKDLRALDEMSFAIGRRVIPWIAPEVRIFQALEKYYAVERRPRYITHGDRLDEASKRRRSATRPAASSAAATPPAATVDPRQDDPLEGERRDLEAGYGRPWQEVAEELEKRASAAPVVEPPKPPSASMPLPVLAERYCEARTHDDLALAALEFAVGRAERILFLAVRADRASVWHERGLNVPDEKRNGISFQVTSEPLFTLLMGDDYYFGDLPACEDDASFYRRLGVDAPLEVLLVPIRVNDRLVAVVLVDGGRDGRLHGDIQEFLRAFRLFGMSLGLVALRKKIGDAARPLPRVAV